MSRTLLALAVCFGSVSTTTLMGCLITQDPSFDEPANFPPSVHGTATTPMYQTLTRRVGPLDNPFPADGGDVDPANDDVTIAAIVRDANLRDNLEGRVFLNLNRAVDNPQQFLVAEILIREEGTFERRVPEFTVPRSRLVANCNTIELHVSREFRRFPSLEPEEDGMGEGTRRDVGIGVWFVGGLAEGATEPSFTGCGATTQ